MRRALALASTALVLLLAACSGLPSAGPVNPGNQPGDAADAPTYDIVPDPPRVGATPDQIVDGFLRAGAGPQDNWARAREYLSEDFREQWQPAEVIIDRLADRATPGSPEQTPTAAPSAGPIAQVSQRIAPEAYVLADGQYTQADPNASTTLSFRLVQDADEQWRIVEAPDTVVLYQEVFPIVYQQASVMFFEPTWRYLVPDVRWFPRPLIASRVAQALIDGAPSEWLAESVVSAFPEDISLVGGAVPLDGDTAQVEVNAAAFALDTLTLDRMQTQLEKSLESVDVAGAQMRVGTTVLDAQEVPVTSTLVESSPLLQVEGGEFGFLGAEDIEPIPGLSTAVDLAGAVSVTVAPQRTSAAVKTATGAVVRARDDGTVQSLDVTRQNLVAPSIDPDGTVWSVPVDAPSAFLVFPVGGEPAEITAPWSSAATVTAVQVSREGARLAALVTANGRTEVWVAGIVREDEAVVGLSDPFVLTTSPSAALDLAWLDDVTLGVLLASEETPTLLRQTVGGRGTQTVISAGVVDISGGNSTARLRTDEGGLLVERGQNWEEIAGDVEVLAVQQGRP